MKLLTRWFMLMEKLFGTKNCSTLEDKKLKRIQNPTQCCEKHAFFPPQQLWEKTIPQGKNLCNISSEADISSQIFEAPCFPILYYRRCSGIHRVEKLIS